MGPTILQEPGTRSDLEATPSRNIALSQTGDFLAMSGRDEMIARKAVEYSGDEVIFNPDYMEADTPYPFRFLGYPLLAMKRDDGAIDFYYLPL